MKKIGKICVALLLVVALLCGISLLYLNQQYSAQDGVTPYLEGTQQVVVTTTDFGWFFDGPSSEYALVFYQGAKVDAKAYAPLLNQLASGGIDCFLVEMPYSIAFFDMEKADCVLEQYSYSHWYMMGHSLGGVAASNYAYSHLNEIEGIIFLASYPTKDLKNSSIRVLSIFGSEDQVLNLTRYEEAKNLLPKDYQEICISGGNHAGFGMYGIQKGDGKATISSQEQWDQTADAIEVFIEEEQK